MNVRLAAIFLAVMYAVLGMAAPSFSQNVTSGSISGVAVDQQGGVMPGVTIDAVHGPTGTQYSATTDADGRFFISSVRVGGPYTVTATLAGFRSQEQANVTVPLGETIAFDFKLPLANVTETVTVEGAIDPVINPSRTGPAANVSPISSRTCRRCRAASKISRARRRIFLRSPSTPSRARCLWQDGTIATTASRSTVR